MQTTFVQPQKSVHLSKKSHAALVSVGFDRPEIEQDRFCRRLISVSTSFFTNVVICAYVIMRIVLAICKQWTRSTQTTFCHSIARQNQCPLKNNSNLNTPMCLLLHAQTQIQKLNHFEAREKSTPAILLNTGSIHFFMPSSNFFCETWKKMIDNLQALVYQK